MEIGERIKQLRIAKDLTQEQLADILNIKRQTIQKYENGVITNIPYDNVIGLSQVLGITPSELMGWTNETETKLETLSQEQNTLLDYTKKMSVEDINLIIEFAKRLKNAN